MITYRDAGVDIDAGEETVRRIKPLVKRTFRPEVLTDIGGFGGLFRPQFEHYTDPVLVSSIDGVGTKVKVAILAQKHDTIGEDLVNHCVNDIAVTGAEPLFFLDYFATGKLIPRVAEQIVRGLVRGCAQNGCALIGGETAEMPDLYAPEDYDLAGTIVGVADRPHMPGPHRVREGDQLIGLPSTGLHTNGYTLARKVLLKHYAPTDRPELLGGERLVDALLRVHRSYLRAIRLLLKHRMAHAFAHITGGGIPGNLPRVLPEGLRAEVDWTAWERPPLFRLIQQVGHVPEEDMRRTFNLGIGLIAVIPAGMLKDALILLKEIDEEPISLGRIVRK